MAVRSVVVAALLAAAAPARAGETWATAADAPARADRDEAFEEAMAAGDDAALAAASGASNSGLIRKRALAAADAYERAAKLRPDDPEPHFRAANVLYGFFLDCEPSLDPLCLDDQDAKERKEFEKVAARVIRHWEAVEAVAPLDPRLAPSPRTPGLRFERAILHTKLVTEEHLRAAVRDYERVLEEAPDPGRLSLAVGNLAEVHMMLGDLDAAIERYREAASSGTSTSLVYGLAVAYDRDGQGAKARELVRALGVESFQQWQREVLDGGTFYVPEAEVFYYYALAYEALGKLEHAATAWRRFVREKPHPRYVPRAQENLAAVEKRLAGSRR